MKSMRRMILALAVTAAIAALGCVLAIPAICAYGLWARVLSGNYVTPNLLMALFDTAVVLAIVAVTMVTAIRLTDK